MDKISLAKKVFISLFLLVLFSKPNGASEKPEIFVQMASIIYFGDLKFI